MERVEIGKHENSSADCCVREEVCRSMAKLRRLEKIWCSSCGNKGGKNKIGVVGSVFLKRSLIHFHVNSILSTRDNSDCSYTIC